MFKRSRVALVALALVGCGPEEEAAMEEPAEMDGGAEEELAETEANAGEVTVPPGEVGEFTNESGTFSVSFVEIEDLGPALEPRDGMEGLVEPIRAQQGGFIGIIVQAENTGVSPADFAVDATVVTVDGVTFAEDLNASTSAGNIVGPDSLGDTAQMNPGESTRTRYVFDLPPDADLDVLHLSNPYLLAEPSSGLFLELGDMP